MPHLPQIAICARTVIGAVVVALCAGHTAHADRGAEAFQEKCASCHGADGQGDTDGYEDPLFGDHSINVLASLIERTMPDGEPESCVGDEARQVATYIYHEFYSPAARQRKGLVTVPRVELLRLSVPQYRNAVADLIGQFTPRPSERRGRRGRTDDSEPVRGLRAEYFQSKGMSKADKRRLSRVDASVDFDYGEGSPAQDITADQFAIIWTGALAAPRTGYYEFRVSTQNGARLYLNMDGGGRRGKLRDDSSAAGQAALVDAWVSSGKMQQHTARVYLLGGRRYPIRLEFFKYKEKTSSIRLEWKPPHGTWSVLDRNHLTTATVPRTYVVDTPFPPDDRSLGYERGSAVSREWHEATNHAAVSAAAEIVDRLPLLTGVDEKDENRVDELKKFITRFARVAFRRPLTESEQQVFGTTLFENSPDPEAAVRRAVLLILSSPHFLYVDLTAPDESPTQHVTAARLSFVVWDSIPDRELLAAADEGELATPEQIQAQARRLIADPRARSKVREFFRHWLEMEERDVAKDKHLYPEFDETVMADLRHSLELFVDEVVWSKSSDYRQLLLADHLLLNDRLRGLYVSARLDEAPPPDDLSLGESGSHSEQDDEKADIGDDAGQVDQEEHESDDASVDNSGESRETDPAVAPNIDFAQVQFPSERRAGVLTHPFLLSAFAYHNNTSPIHRGVFLTRNIVGRSLKAPPIAVAFKDDEFAPDLTMREKITQLTSDKACLSCHSIINPLGFALENYDAVGRWRTSEKDKPVDTTAKYTTADGRTLEVRSARDVAEFAVASELAHRSFVASLFRHLVQQNPAAYGADTLESLRTQFEADDFNIQELMIHVAVLAATYDLETDEPPVEQ